MHAEIVVFPTPPFSEVSDLIDVYHVTSPHLRDYLVGGQQIKPEKVALATLADLTVGEISSGGWTSDTTTRPFTVAFIGRYTQQKRPNCS